jgi:hypothetical protein
VYSPRGISEDMVGGALVRRMIPGKPEWPGGHLLTREQFLAIPVENRFVMVDQGHFEIIIRDPLAQRYIVPREDGRFDVVSGRVLNAEPLDEAAAQQLAGDDRPIRITASERRPALQPAASERPAEKRTATRQKATAGQRGRPRLTDQEREAKRLAVNAQRRQRRQARRAGADQHAGQG